MSQPRPKRDEVDIQLAVLIVEDLESDAQLIVRLLKKAGYELVYEQVETAEQMRSALEKRTWDIVISDYSLPQFDGRAALELLKEKRLDIPFIVVSGTIGEERAVAMMKAGAHDYVMKGNLARLTPAVKRELEQAEARREQKRTMDQLRQLSSAVEHSPASIMITDIDGNIEYVNPRFTALTGYTLDEVRGKVPSHVFGAGAMQSEIRTGYSQAIFFGKEWRGEFLNHKKDGEHYWEHASISPIADSKGVITHFVVVSEDITSRKEDEEKIKRLNTGLEQLAMTDYLTSLYNRRYFMQRGMEEFKRASRSKQPLSLLMLDVDEFKKINDSYGHEAGDRALQQVAVALKSSLREIDILGRMGGEEFAVLLPNTSLGEAVLLAERVRRTMANTSFVTLGASLTITITVSIGVTAVVNKMFGIDDLLRNADAAMYQAKHNGGNCVIQYENISGAHHLLPVPVGE
ncbi:MAG: diguanylate cyclase [Anaerolineales bacterium]|nr:diguanylate cyclase [Anaerolineales bacterium]